jgi:hypothetical protein
MKQGTTEMKQNTLLKLFPFFLAIVLISLPQSVCPADDAPNPRLSMFIGVDVSGSFLKSKYFEKSLDFLANYLYAHLNGLGDLEVPKVLFIGSLGGQKKDEAKSLYPIQTFEGKSVEEIRKKLGEIFPKKHEDPYTDFNAFFEAVEETVKDRKLILRPISILLLSDGIPDYPGQHHHDVKSLNVKPLELLSRNVTVRLIYTSAVTGKEWQDKIKRQRVKIWTQDADIMETWNDPKIFVPTKPITDQEKFFAWVKDNIDFPVRSKRVD